MANPLLKIQDLQVIFETGARPVQAVNRISLEISQGETFGLVGESGCGKSVTALSIMRLVPSPPGKVCSGQISLEGADLLQLPVADFIAKRGQELSMIFQEPMTSFNPVQTIGKQLAEVLEIHEKLDHKSAKTRVIAMLERVGLSDPSRQYQAFPHELSGGMRQRAMIAMALLCDPKLLIADEPTTALDVTVQAQILALLQELQVKTKMAVLLITHNLGAVAELADRVAVMYAGKLVEVASVEELFYKPMHPYTFGLLKSIPGYDSSGELFAIPGQIPDLTDLPSGCAFAPRCPQATSKCRKSVPELENRFRQHQVACYHHLS